MKTSADVQITPGGGDVFADLGFSSAESRNLHLRSQLMTALRERLDQEGWTQAEAARRLKVSQPRISDLKRGQISRFSLDMLVNLATLAGLDIDLRVRPTRRVPDASPTSCRRQAPYRFGQ